MRFSMVLPFAAAVLALDTQSSDLRQGCENVDCDNVPTPKVVRGMMSVRDDSCQYSCHLKRLRATSGEADTPDLNETGDAIAAPLSGHTNNMEKRADPPGIPKAVRGQFTVIKTIPRRSEGVCKFVTDVLAKPEDATPAMSCRAAGDQMLRNIPRRTAGILAARLAVEYDENCVLHDKTSYTTADGKVTFPVFSPDDASELSNEILGQKLEYFFFDCGAVFLNQPVVGNSGSYVAAQIKMIRDSRGLTPVLAESFPPEVFANVKTGPFTADAPPPWLQDAQSGI